MLVTFSRRLRKADEKIASLTFFDSYGKIAKVLLELIGSKGENENGHIVLNLSLARQEVADMAGVSRETVTRIFHEFQIRGCLEVAGKKITILKQALLERELL